MSRSKTGLEDYLVYGIDEKNRRVFFGTDLLHSEPDNVGGFSQASVQYVIRAIYRMVENAPKTPIEIHMDSYGGDAYAMLGLYDLMQEAPTQFKFFGRGAIMSSATWIMAGSDERYLYPNTAIMVHNGHEWLGSINCTDLEIYNAETVRLNQKLYEIYANNSRMPKNFWQEICKRDLYLTAEEAVFLGLADKVIQPKKRGNLRKVRQHHLSKKVDSRKVSQVVNRLMDRIQATPRKLEIHMNDPKLEPQDDKITIEELQSDGEQGNSRFDSASDSQSSDKSTT